MPDMKKRIHFVGAGGCSMSELATLMHARGHRVTGSDRTASHKTEKLNKSGIPVWIGHDAAHVQGADLVVYTAAISQDNAELLASARLGIPTMERADFLGRLMEGYGEAICIAGTHGKTTTTAMIAQAFFEAGANPTVHIGGELPALGGGTVVGGEDFFIAEACEFAGTFWKFRPTISVILNIDEDHLDFYKDIDDIEAGFLKFARLTPKGGLCVGCGDDARVMRVLDSLPCATRTYGLEPHNMLRAESLSYDEEGRGRFTATLFGHPLAEIDMRVAGAHNVLNALAALAVADWCRLPMTRVGEILSRFTGASRRFEQTSTTDGVRIYHDYGHNPAEMKNAIHLAKLIKGGRVWAVWQPHTFSRTKKLWHGFINDTFGEADRVVVTDIMGAREPDPGDINSGMLVDALRAAGTDAVWTPSFLDTEAHLRAHWRPGDVVVTLGCGDIDLLNEQIAGHGDSAAPESIS